MKKLLLLLSIVFVTITGYGQATGYVLPNFASSGSIGTASTTVDVYSRININQTTPSITLTVPPPTNTSTKVVEVWIGNKGTVSFTLRSLPDINGFVVDTGQAVILKWIGAKYVVIGKGGTGGSTIIAEAPLSYINDTLKIDTTKVPYFSGGISGPKNSVTYLNGVGVWDTIDISGKQDKAVVVSSNQTAINDGLYNNVASATYTDPSPVEGKGFTVFVRNGTATVGGTSYATAGTVIRRIFHSGAWANYANVLTSPTPVNTAIATGDNFQTVSEKLQGQFNQVAYAQYSNATVQTFLTNVIANGGSVSPVELNAATYFLQGLGKIGISANCVYANLGLGDYLAAQTNLIYQSTNKYVVGVGATLTVNNWDRLTGWRVPSGGVTQVNTNFNVSGYNIAGFTTVVGLSGNSNNTSVALFGYTTSHGLIKTANSFGFSYAQFQGKTGIIDPWDGLSNSQGNHILVQGAAGCQWYKDAVQVGASTSASTGTMGSNNILIGGSNVIHGLCFNKALTLGESQQLDALLSAVQAMVGRPTLKTTLKSIIFEGTSQTASYVPPFSTYSPRYVTQVLTAIKNITVTNTLVGMPAISGKTSATMLTEATADTKFYNTGNYNSNTENVFVYEGGINDIGNNSVLAADFVYDTYIVPCLQNRIAAGYTVLIETIPSFGGNCTYIFGAVGGLANYNSVSLGSRRLNYRIKSDPRNYNGVNAHGVILSDEVPEFQDATNTTYFQDGLHYTGAGSTGSAPIRARLVANQIDRCLGRKIFSLGEYQSEIPQFITADIVPASSSTQSSYRAFKYYSLAGTFNFTLPDPMLFYGTEYILTNISGTQTIVGTVDGAVNPTLSTPYQKLHIKAVQTASNTFEWVTQ